MKTVALSIIMLLCFGAFTSCKNDWKNTEANTETNAIDTIAKVESPAYMYVTASSGLTLREFPNLQSEKLVVMPLGTKVKMITVENKTTMNVGGIDGAMDEVEYNNKKGFAFNGFLSKFFPPDTDISPKNYAEALKNEFPKVSYTESTGGSASTPTKTETLLLPTVKWHEAFFTAQQLFDFPKVFAFPNPKGPNQETVKDPKPIKNTWTSQLNISRNEYELNKIVYEYRAEGFGYTVTITQESNGMKLEKNEIAD